MIGVISKPGQEQTVGEFFELFKTPWEKFRDGGAYDVVVATDARVSLPSAKLSVVFGPEETLSDRHLGLTIRSLRDRGIVEWRESRIPVYGQVASFDGRGESFLAIGGNEAAGVVLNPSGCKILRVGYDLFDEVDHLLRRGQPAENAPVPTLDRHIAMLRKWILDSGIPLVEIPPSPHGLEFITCLTHDIDFMGIRDHKFDHTLFGFIYRCLLPRYLKGLRREVFWARYKKNLQALFSLPLVHMGVRPDFWYPLDRYAEVEKDLKSTFFFLPFKDRAGRTPDGRTEGYRASRYDIERYKEPIRSLEQRGCEIGLHGIDSWRDTTEGRKELEVIRGITGKDRIGVRMHWLYFSEESPKHLEEAGAHFDSTLGYNGAVGYRSGTAQVFRLPRTTKIFELPLHVQDTALFYTNRMNTSEAEAISRCRNMIEETKASGGVFTINWHDRSLAPERNWDTTYMTLLETLRKEKTWFATAGEAVAWFEKRRTGKFEILHFSGGERRMRVRVGEEKEGPPLVLRVHRPAGVTKESTTAHSSYVDYPLCDEMEVSVGS